MEWRCTCSRDYAGLLGRLFALGCFVLIHHPLVVQAAQSSAAAAITVGSKSFTESVILGEVLTQLAGASGHPAVHKRQLGGTAVLWQALLAGEIDAYPAYTGTLVHEILSQEGLETAEQLRQALHRHGLRATAALGFNNTYALGVKAEVAARLKLRSISDLIQHPQLVLGLSNEFMDRADGWPGLRRRYRLPHKNVRGLDHDLAYRGIESDTLQVIDLYSTDAEVDYYQLVQLKDDLAYFPAYDAVVIYRADLQQRAPAAVAAFDRLGGTIDERSMSGLNARVKLKGESEAAVAADFLNRSLGLSLVTEDESPLERLARHTRDHLLLVGVSLLAAIFLAIPLGILASRYVMWGRVVLGIASVVQTIPTLALFVFMIPLLGIGEAPAIVALFLYSLLPIIHSTHAGLKGIPRGIIESAQALGLPPIARLRLVELPLASGNILAGIKTSAVINVGTATLGALIGAGGYGQPILTGIRLDNTSLILQGAIPAAVLALTVQGLLDLAQRALAPRSKRAQASGLG